MGPVRFRDSPALRGEGVLQLCICQPRGANCTGAAVRVALCPLWISILAFVPPSPPVSPCVSAYLQNNKQLHGFALEEAQTLAPLWPCENTPVFSQKSGGERLVGGDFSFCLFLLLVVEGQCSISSLFSLCYLAGGSNSKSRAAFRKCTGNDCEVVPRSGCQFRKEADVDT